MRKRLFITIIFAAIIGLSISSCNGEKPNAEEWVPDTISVADIPSSWPPDTIAFVSGWPPDTITISYKISSELLVGEYVKIDAITDTLSWPSDSVTSINTFSKYYLNEIYDATK